MASYERVSLIESHLNLPKENAVLFPVFSVKMPVHGKTMNNTNADKYIYFHA